MMSVDSMINGFPVPTLPKIEGRPTYDTITALATEIHRNTASIQSELGGGANGHLGISLNPPVYATVSATAWMNPPNPGTLPIIPPTATQVAIRALERQHEESLRMWRTHNTVQDAIKAQIVQAINPIWIETLNNRYTGYAGVTIRDLLNHLYDRYGSITAHDLDENDKHFRTDYDPSQPIETLYKQLDDAMLYADAGHQAYTANQITNNAYNLVARTGLFKRACRDWRASDTANKTWANFKIAFTAAWLENQEDEAITTQGQGYHPANHVNAADTWANETADAFANLASATAADRSTIASLVATTQDLTTQLATKDTLINELRRQLRNRPATAAPGRADQGGNIPNNQNYCWTHGWIVADDHTSASCTRKRQGHKPTATRADTMGGNDRGKARAQA
jgi:hypothetical protein